MVDSIQSWMCAILAERKVHRPQWIAPIGRGLAMALALIACSCLSGCDRNSATPYLIPTGIRTAILNPGGGVFGVLHYGPAQRADLAVAPFPPTRVELLRGRDSSLVTQTTTASTTNTFSIVGVQPGDYLVRAVVRGFSSPLVRVKVLDRPRDAGDVTLPMATSVYSPFIFLIGTMPGYDYDSYFSNIFNSPAIGVFSYPSDFHPEATVTVPAGTQEFMFVTDSSFPDDLIGWGGDAADLLTLPLVDHRMTLGHGLAHNLKVSFPATGAYTFALDEARQTFSIIPASAAQSARAAPSSRRTR